MKVRSKHVPKPAKKKAQTRLSNISKKQLQRHRTEGKRGQTSILQVGQRSPSSGAAFRYDPTNTTQLRLALSRELGNRFDTLIAEVRKLVLDEDAFGLKPATEDPYALDPSLVGNFDPNQPRDNEGKWTSSPVSAVTKYLGIIPKFKEFAVLDSSEFDRRFGESESSLHGGTAAIRTTDGSIYIRKGYEEDAVHELIHAAGTLPDGTTDFLNEGVTQSIALMVGKRSGLPVRETYSEEVSAFEKYVLPASGLSHEEFSSGYAKAKDKGKFVTDSIWSAHGDKFSNEDDWGSNPRLGIEKSIRSFIGPGPHLTYLVDELKITQNALWGILPITSKLNSFMGWLKSRLGALILGQTEKDLLKQYANEDYQKGAGRSFDDAKKAMEASGTGQEKLGWYAGTREDFLGSAFNQPVAVEKVQQLAERSFSDLKGVTEATAAAVHRVVMDGLVRGDSPRVVAKAITDQVAGIGKARAQTIARTELIRAHSEGQLDALKGLGVQKVGVAVEWDTVGDGKVCPKCRPLQGIVLKIDEARGMIPRHPNCRCAWIPANVGESGSRQKRSKAAILTAIQKSSNTSSQGAKPMTAGTEIDQWGPAQTISKDRPESVLNWLTDPDKIVFNGWSGLGLYCGNEVLGVLESPTDNAFNPGQPRDSDGKWTKGFSSSQLALHVVQGTTVVKALGGSTGAKLVKTKDGDHLVLKNAPHLTKQLQNEGDADNAYRAAGVKVPMSGVVVQGTHSNETVHKFSKYVEGAMTLGEWEKTASKADLAKVHDALRKDFAADALLANWDVIGMSKDNVMISPGGHVLRVDNGGALLYRAQGTPKGALFGTKVTELDTMRDPTKNPQAAAVFGKVTDEELHGQMKGLLEKREQILGAVTDPETKKILSQRLDHYEQLVKAKEPDYGLKTTPTPQQSVPLASKVPQPVQTPTPSPVKGMPVPQAQFSSGQGLADYLKANGADSSFTKGHYEKLMFLNPDGIKDGTLYIAKAKAANDAQVEHLKKVLPPGTKIAKVVVTESDVASGKVPQLHKAKTIAKTETDSSPAPAPTPTPVSTPKKTQLDPQAGPLTQKAAGQSLTDIEQQIAQAADKVGTHTDKPVGPIHLSTIAQALQQETGTVVKNGEIAKTLKKLGVPLKPLAEAKITELDKPKENPVPASPKKKTPTPTPTPKSQSKTPGWELHQDYIQNPSKYLPEIKSGESVVLPHTPEWDHEAHLAWKSTLTSKEESVIHQWKGSPTGIRKAFAKGKSTAETEALKSALDKAPPYEGVVYRGVHSTEGVNQWIRRATIAGIGGTITEVAPTGFSLNPYVANSFSHGQLMIRVRAKTVKPIHKVNGFNNDSAQGEKEAISMPGTTYRILGIYTKVKTSDPVTGLHSNSTVQHFIDLEEV